jgi:phage virion morphogenesis protein
VTGARVTVTDRDVQRALAALARLGRDPSPALKALGPLLVAATRNRIVAEQAPDGSAWPALNKDYRRVEKRGPGMLRERAMRGGLFGSLTSQVEGKALRIGTNKIYAATHQFGATIRPKNAPALVFKLGGRTVRAGKVTIPARPFLGISAADRETIREVFSDFARRATAPRAR